MARSCHHPPVETLLAGGAFFESPRWHDGRWWFSDFFRRRVVTTEGEVVRVEGQPSGLGWLPDGSLLVVSMHDRRVLRLRDGVLALHADLSDLCDWHANDMVVAPDGRAYVGNFGFDLGNEDPRPTGLVHVGPDGSAKRVAEELMFPNGMLLHDGTLIVGETYGARLTEFSVQPDGTLSDRRVFAGVPGAAPDGCALDAEGCVWFADARSNRCVRVARGGEIADVVSVDEGLRCFACMLGGDDGRTLAICAAADYDENRPHDAVVLATRVAVPHAGLP
jgi:sugar lactone lactonase YvrE